MISSGFYPITLVETILEYDRVHTFRFSTPGPVPFLPGQYAHVLAPHSPPGPNHVRHLSIASIPEEGELKFSVDLRSQTEYKQKLGAMEPGETAHLFKVKGEFTLDASAARVVFVAGGLGITPIRSLLAHIVHHKTPVDWALIHVARTGFLYQQEMEEWGSRQWRIRRDQLEAVMDLPSPDSNLWYVSGSSRFVEGVRSLLHARNVPDAQIRVEDFR